MSAAPTWGVTGLDWELTMPLPKVLLDGADTSGGILGRAYWTSLARVQQVRQRMMAKSALMAAIRPKLMAWEEPPGLGKPREGS